ncbi:protein PAL OF QUIRKY [Cornus florida]|uniref:protein PAL OF QUIRKY n=1 Tax=Cornus florida TaxID=4283 RepID=UPI0028A062AD|nr:protein PAL OF QUIRKY [Cornus florida]
MSSKPVTTMTTHHQNELDSATNDSVKSSSSLQSDYPPDHDYQPRVRFMCSFGGKILPRPHDNQLRYVGGDTRIVAVHRHTTFSSLLNKLSKLSGTTANLTVKYQLPNEDLDSLISVTTDEDVDNMMEEYERVSQNNIHSKTARLRLFLFSADTDSRHSSISSLLGGSAKREHWFLDALNGGAGPSLERGRSEVSSIISEVPDYLFGLDNSDEPPREPKLKNRFGLSDNASLSDPGSPAPPVSSQFYSTSSSLAAPSIPNLPPVKTKPDNPVPVVESREIQNEGFAPTGEPQITGYAGKPMWHYPPETHYPSSAVQSIPFYYVPGPVSQGNVPLQQVQIRAPYVQQFSVPPGQIPVRFHQQVPGMGQVYGGGVRPVAAMDAYDMSGRVVSDGMNPPYDMSGRAVSDGMNPPMYYGGMAPQYPGMVLPVGEELQGTGTEAKMDRVFQSS